MARSKYQVVIDRLGIGEESMPDTALLALLKFGRQHDVSDSVHPNPARDIAIKLEPHAGTGPAGREILRALYSLAEKIGEGK